MSSHKHKKHLWPGEKPHAMLIPFHLFKAQGHWFYLLHALLMLLLLYPYLESPGEAQAPLLLRLANSAIVVLIIYTLSFNRRQLILACILGLPAAITEWLPYSPTSLLVSQVSTLLFYVYAIIMILPYIIESQEIGADEIFGTASLYILIGLTWALLFQTVELLHPGSFYVEPERNLDNALTWSDFLFFSFTTLTTLGYGDITPVTSAARSLSILESLTGVIFVALLIARSIGLYVAQMVIANTRSPHE